MKIFKISLVTLILTFLFSFTGDQSSTPKFDTFVDPRDKQEYITVKIGNQWWFAENLNYEVEKSWCHECETYGRMYTYESSFEACPAGWHIPTVAEWNELITFLGGVESAGNKMKSLEKWKAPNTGADNSSGFSAIPSPEKGTNGEIRNPRGATWWTSEVALDPAAWTMNLKPDQAGIVQLGFYRVSGFAVRCVKN
jgi:uncharacterized protein (TIGR02145 family)